MIPRPSITKRDIVFNKYGSYLYWPHFWVLILGCILSFLCVCIVAMEITHTMVDFRRSTALGGFIAFIPLTSCIIMIFVTGKIKISNRKLEIFEHSSESLKRECLFYECKSV